ncbi:MAG: hypothetical protein ACFFG0_16365, partial [Candidatus Thorarchaeota archaeon]
DIIISDDGRNIIKSYLYRTKKAGIHESLEKIPQDIIKVHKKDFEDIEKFYNRVLESLIKNRGMRVSSIRVFKEKAINYINQHCINIEDLPFDALLIKFLDLVQKLANQDLFVMYPEPKILKFLKKIVNFLNGYQLNNIFKIIYPLFPEFNISFTFSSKEFLFILHLQKIFVSKSKTPYLRLKLMLPNELGINVEGLNENEILELVRERLKTETAYYLKQNDIVSLLRDLINLPVKIREEDLLLFLQKILFGYRSYEKHWFLRPKPIRYNTLLRFLIRIFGFNFNLRKLSHWAISDFISTIFESWFGLNSKNLIIITNTEKSKKLKFNNFNYLRKISEYVFLIETENKTLTKISSISKEEIFINREFQSLESIRVKISEKYGFLSNIIIIDKLLLQSFIKEYFFNHSKYRLFSKISTLKMLKKQKFFYIFPEIPLYKLIHNKRSIALLKLILPILIDKHEF